MLTWNSIASKLPATVFLMGLSMTKLTSSQNCSVASLNLCFSFFRLPMITFDLPWISLDDVIPSWNRTVLTALCQVFRSYSNCMKPVSKTCNTEKQLHYLGIDNAWRYLCQNSTDEFANFSSCFSRKSLRNEIDQCNATFVMELTLPYTNSYSYCSYQEQFMSCVSNATRQNCGEAAGDWDDGFVDQLYQPILSYLSCPGWGPDSPAENATVIAVFIGITASVMIVIIIALIIMVVNRRKALQQTTTLASSLFPNETPVNPNDPPSYCEPYVVYEPTSSSETPVCDSTTEDVVHFRRRFVDPLTGHREDGGLVEEANLPYKVCPSFPPLYAYQPPPSFEETFPVDDTIVTQSVPCDGQTASEIVNEAFSNDEESASETVVEAVVDC